MSYLRSVQIRHPMTRSVALFMSRSLLISSLCIFFYLTGECQDPSITVPNRNNGLFFIFQLGYNKGVGKINLTETTSTRNSGYMVSARATTGYFLNAKTALGLSLGLDGYHKPDFNLLPASMNMRYFLKPDRNSIFFDADLGYSLKLSESFKSGMLGDLSVGYRMNAGKKANLLLSTGVNLQRIENANTYIYNRQTGSTDYVQSSFWLTSFAFNLGFLF